MEEEEKQKEARLFHLSHVLSHMTQANGTWRDVYRYVIDPEVFLDSGNVRALLQRGMCAAREVKARSRQDTLTALRDWQRRQLCEYQAIFERAAEIEHTAEVRRILLRQTTPVAGALGTWLQGMSAPGVFEDEVQLKLMTLLACDVGVGKPESSRYDEFKTLLRCHGLAGCAIPTNELHALHVIEDTAFFLPASLIAMSRRSDEFAPEISGIDWCLRMLGLFPCWEVLATAASIDWKRLDLSCISEGVECDLRATSEWVVEQFRNQGTHVAARVDRGIAWCLDALNQWGRWLVEFCDLSLDPVQAMARLVQERAREGAVYHGKLKLNGQTLSARFKQAQEDPFTLVRALAESRLVRPGQPDRSPLINDLIDPNGPMFRVFSKEDIRTVRRWIDHIGTPGVVSPLKQRGVESVTRGNPAKFEIKRGDTSFGLTPGNIREAYFLLQGRALAPKTREFAVSYVEEWLTHARASIDRADRSLPREWRPGVLREWLLDCHDRNGAKFEQSNTDEMPSRDQVIHSTLQLAPLTLIDGAWLQGFTDCRLASSRIGFSLFETYWDELGNGVYAINHPKIYRDVLRQMGIELPPTGSLRFALDRRLEEVSFRLPVYWLCLGKLPLTYMSIILGMNLAMEFSGVGGTYRSIQRFLRHHGFSTLFVDIHNTIDNISTGHTAWAARAIDTYMQKILNLRDSSRVESEWDKLRTGYESLSPLPSRAFDRGYFSNFSRSSEMSEGQTFLFHHQAVSAGGR